MENDQEVLMNVGMTLVALFCSVPIFISSMPVAIIMKSQLP